MQAPEMVWEGGVSDSSAHSDTEMTDVESDKEIPSPMPEVISKDSDDEQKTSHHNFADSKDTKFSTWMCR